MVMVALTQHATAFVPNSTDNAKNVKRNVPQTSEKQKHSRIIMILTYTNPSQLRETNIVFSAMRLAEHSFCGARCPMAIQL